jgi:hypothetical protein
MYTDHSNVACDIFSVISRSVRVEARCSLGRDVIGWRQSHTTSGTVCDNILVRQFAQGDNGLLAGDDPVLDPSSTEYDMEMRREAEEKQLH